MSLATAMRLATPSTSSLLEDYLAHLDGLDLSDRARHQAAGPCDYADICETCDNYTTGPEFTPALTSQLADTRALHADAEQRGRADEAQRHQRTATALEEHLRLLQPR